MIYCSTFFIRETENSQPSEVGLIVVQAGILCPLNILTVHSSGFTFIPLYKKKKKTKRTRVSMTYVFVIIFHLTIFSYFKDSVPSRSADTQCALPDDLNDYLLSVIILIYADGPGAANLRQWCGTKKHCV